ncbi:hypothetical protein IMF27_21775 [Pseudomonas sp. PCH199]|nr:hypothetical protein [Pseudomonas sp. PCH199]
MILKGCADLETVHAFAEQLRLKIQSLRIRGRSSDKMLDTITASFGFALFEAGDNLETLQTRADNALSSQAQWTQSGASVIRPSHRELSLAQKLTFD